MEPVIGIDLGTTNSVVAVVEDGVPVVVTGRSGYKLLPSVVAFSRNGKRLVGHLAKRQAVTNPAHTVYAAKRLIGQKWSGAQVRGLREQLSYAIRKGPNDDVRVVLGEELLSIPELSAMVLTELKLDAEAHLSRPVTQAVITVPAHFNDNQRQATRDAGRIAGLDVLRIINEPTAAALAYGQGEEGSRKILVFDMGGGTFDVSILEIANGVFDVIATGGDTFLGGEDFDRRLIERLAASFEKETKIDLLKDPMARQRLRDAAEKGKMELSEARQTEINLPFICSGPTGGLHLQRTVTREEFEALAEELIERSLTQCRRVLEDAELAPSEVDEVLLVGGMTRLPLLQRRVKELFGREPSRGVHPDEVVATGAALQGWALTAESDELLLLDVTPHSLGIAIVQGLFKVLIPRNTTVPTSARHVFTTVRDNQTSARIIVSQGEALRAEENELLGDFILSGLEPAPRGEVEIEVIFEISADGIVSVSGRDTKTGRQQSITVTSASGLSEEELRRMMEENADYLLEQKTDELFDAAAREVEKVAEEILYRLEPARQALGENAQEPVEKARQLLDEAKTAIAGRDLLAVMEMKGRLSRSLALLKGIAPEADR